MLCRLKPDLCPVLSPLTVPTVRKLGACRLPLTLLTASLSLYVLGLQVLENVGGVQVAFGVD